MSGKVCFGVGALAIVAWLLGGAWIWSTFPTIDVRGQFGDMFGALTSIFSVLSFVGVLYAIYRQSHESTQTSHADGFISVFEIMTAERVTAAIDWVETVGRPTEMWNDSENAQAQLVLNRLETIATMCDSKYLDEKVVLRVWGRTMVRCAYALEPFMAERREARRDELLWESFGKLSDKAKSQYPIVDKDCLRRYAGLTGWQARLQQQGRIPRD